MNENAAGAAALRDARIFVAGHRGLVGSALVRALQRKGCDRLLLRTRAELDLTDAVAVDRFFRETRPEVVFLAAARVGGIHANNTLPADFIRDNLMIQNNVIDAAWRHPVDRLLFLGSSCIYPKHAPQPMSEAALLTGPLEPTNRPYALAKIAGIELCWAHNRQHGTRFLAAMPTNLYGPGDNYHPEHSHVIPGLIRRFHEAVTTGADTVTVWGSGRPRREFLYSDDMAEGCLHLAGLPEAVLQDLLGGNRNDGLAPVVNIGAGTDLPIADLAGLIARVTGYRGRIVFDAGKPDGTPRKLMDSSRMQGLGWRPLVSLADGLQRAYADFKAREAAA